VHADRASAARGLWLAPADGTLLAAGRSFTASVDDDAAGATSDGERLRLPSDGRAVTVRLRWTTARAT